MKAIGGWSSLRVALDGFGDIPARAASAPSSHAINDRFPLSGVKRTFSLSVAMSAYDPKRTLAS